MHKIFESHHPLRQAKSFKYAFQGILHALVNEPNFRVQLVICLIATYLGFNFHISNVEWGLLIITMGTMLSAEIVNTVVEEVLDAFYKDFDLGVKVIKDLSAGFVFVTALSFLSVSLLIFVPYF